MKVSFYIGITVLALVFATTGLANTPFFAPIAAFFSNRSVLITLGIAQAASILFLVKPTNSTIFNTVAASTLVVSSLILLISNQALFVICNLVLVVSSKLAFSQTSDKNKAVEQASAV